MRPPTLAILLDGRHLRRLPAEMEMEPQKVELEEDEEPAASVRFKCRKSWGWVPQIGLGRLGMGNRWGNMTKLMIA